MLLGTLYVMASQLKNSTLKWVAVLGVATSMFSLSYFYYLLPGSDSHHTRGLTEYFITTGDLNPSTPGKNYFQWPSLFLLCNIATNLLGLELKYFEFILYAAIILLCASSLYGYFSRIYRDGSHIAVIAFFVISTRMLSFQFAPFSLGIGLLFLLFMMESYGSTRRSATLVTLVIFTSMAFIHPFVSVFFVFYTLVRYALSKEKRYLTLFMLTLIIYITVFSFFTAYFPTAVKHLIVVGSQESYPQFFTTVEPVDPLDTIAQMFASTVFIVTVILSGVGFVILFLGRKFRHVDNAIFFSGILYLAAGAFIYILGLRVLYIVAIPVTFGATYFLKTKFKKYYKCFFLILIILFTFVIVHQSYSFKWFQTRDEYWSANFFVRFYNLSEGEHILSHVTVDGYIQAKMSLFAFFENGFRSPPQELETYDCILYTTGLERSLLMWNYSVETEIDKIGKNFNLVFSSGFSFIAVNMLLGTNKT